MKYILYTLLGLSIATVSFGALVQTRVTLPNGATQWVSSDLLKTEDLKVIKIQDGKNTCYIIPTYINNIKASTAISCVN